MDNKNYMSDEQFNHFLDGLNLKDSYKGQRISRDFFRLGNGWLGIVKRLIEDLNEIGWDGTIIKAKEKFGILRFYCNSLTPECEKRIKEAEEESYYFCEVCGEIGNNKSINGWYSTLCKKHEKDKISKKSLSNNNL